MHHYNENKVIFQGSSFNRNNVFTYMWMKLPNCAFNMFNMCYFFLFTYKLFMGKKIKLMIIIHQCFCNQIISIKFRSGPFNNVTIVTLPWLLQVSKFLICVLILNLVWKINVYTKTSTELKIVEDCFTSYPSYPRYPSILRCSKYNKTQILLL